MTSLSPGAATGLLMSLMAVTPPRRQQHQRRSNLSPARLPQGSHGPDQRPDPGLPCISVSRT
jgi:hypothetical protein